MYSDALLVADCLLLISWSYFLVAAVQDSGIVLNNCTMPHVHFRVDLGSAAAVNKVTNSGVLFTTILWLRISSPLSMFTTVLCLIMISVLILALLLLWTKSWLMAGVLFNNCTTHYVGFRADLGSAPSIIMISQKRIEVCVGTRHLITAGAPTTDPWKIGICQPQVCLWHTNFLVHCCDKVAP